MGPFDVWAQGKKGADREAAKGADKALLVVQQAESVHDIWSELGLEEMLEGSEGSFSGRYRATDKQWEQ